ncbi:hypothetical protein GJ631_17265 [Natronomonas sp. CBA1123]|uniref:DUF5810 domain-containing protein n=1 Tax=Natronomonas sp. CBA1123 TaxID=2668070 RepID=UPI0012EA0965|nr:DUF5810 domain-containing protein [Natronomonas sp. CBA1123]MUV88255.1 hypothetical protein [Natronomonas sp. CBA1123]
MGYACPVCSDPQADAGHLANHLAFTAILGDADHETWLGEHVPEWDGMGESELAAVVTDYVEETEFPQVFEDTVGSPEDPDDPLEERSGALFEESGHGHDHGDHDHGHGAPTASTSEPAHAETEAILEEAREMTREMLKDGDAGDDEAENE